MDVLEHSDSKMEMRLSMHRATWDGWSASYATLAKSRGECSNVTMVRGRADDEGGVQGAESLDTQNHAACYDFVVGACRGADHGS